MAFFEFTFISGAYLLAINKLAVFAVSIHNEAGIPFPGDLCMFAEDRSILSLDVIIR